MNRRAHLPNSKILKKRRDGSWRAKDIKSGTQNKRRNRAPGAKLNRDGSPDRSAA